MLNLLRRAAQEGSIAFESAYFGHIVKEEDRKVLAYADAQLWEDIDPGIRGVLTLHFYQMLEGEPGRTLFPSRYTGEVLPVDRVTDSDFDRVSNHATVEIFESMRDMPEPSAAPMIQLGNLLAYKVMAAGAIRNHLVAMVRLHAVPEMGARPLTLVMGTILDLDNREETLLDQRTGRFATHTLENVLKRTGISRAALFPCLDDEGRETADLLVYASSGAAAWFKALEMEARLSPAREGAALLRMITEQTVAGEVPHSILHRMGDELQDLAEDGLTCDAVMQSLERSVGHGVDRLGFQARWESAFGDLGYRPAYQSLFPDPNDDKALKLKMKAGSVTITLPPHQLNEFRQVTVGDNTFIVFKVPEKARVVAGKDLDMRIQPVTLPALSDWMTGSAR